MDQRLVDACDAVCLQLKLVDVVGLAKEISLILAVHLSRIDLHLMHSFQYHVFNI